MEENGAEFFTAPLELNAEELENLGLTEGELLVYGRIPVMVSAQCVVKTAKGCTHDPVTTLLTDRRGKESGEKSLGFCYNVVYNSTPLSLFGEREAWMRMQPKSIRVQFSTEDAKTTKQILDASTASLRGNNGAGIDRR